MRKEKPFWETKNNHITGYVVESLKDVKEDHIQERQYSLKGKRYCKQYASKKRQQRQLEECIILNNEE